MEMNTAAARELGTQLGFGVSGNGYAFGVGGFGGSTAGTVYSAGGGARFLQSLVNQTNGGGIGSQPVSIGGGAPLISLAGISAVQPVSFVSEVLDTNVWCRMPFHGSPEIRHDVARFPPPTIPKVHSWAPHGCPWRRV